MDQPRRLDLGSLLTRAEAAAPVGVADAMAAALLEMLDARDVSFLIADFGGRSLNRLGHTVASEAAAPVGVADAMAAALLEMLDARDVSFLIADFGGRSLNRLGHTVASEGP